MKSVRWVHIWRNQQIVLLVVFFCCCFFNLSTHIATATRFYKMLTFVQMPSEQRAAKAKQSYTMLMKEIFTSHKTHYELTWTILWLTFYCFVLVIWFFFLFFGTATCKANAYTIFILLYEYRFNLWLANNNFTFT